MVASEDFAQRSLGVEITGVLYLLFNSTLTG